MARIRTIKPEFWQHPKVMAVSRDARLLFLGLLNEVDDEGRMRWSAKRVAGVVFPGDEDVNGVEVEAWTVALEQAGLVIRYADQHGPLLAIPGFSEHQRVDRASPSRLPQPPEPSTSPRRAFVEPSTSPRRVLDEPSSTEEEGNGREGEREVEQEPESAAEPRVVEMFSDRAVYFVDRLQQHDEAAWSSFGYPALVKLGKKYGPAVVAEALSYAYEERATNVEHGYPLVEAICKRIQREREESA